jgi:hypothetical protein
MHLQGTDFSFLGLVQTNQPAGGLADDRNPNFFDKDLLIFKVTTSR